MLCRVFGFYKRREKLFIGDFLRASKNNERSTGNTSEEKREQTERFFPERSRVCLSLFPLDEGGVSSHCDRWRPASMPCLLSITYIFHFLVWTGQETRSSTGVLISEIDYPTSLQGWILTIISLDLKKRNGELLPVFLKWTWDSHWLNVDVSKITAVFANETKYIVLLSSIRFHSPSSLTWGSDDNTQKPRQPIA